MQREVVLAREQVAGVSVTALGTVELVTVDMYRGGKAAQRFVTEWITSRPSGSAQRSPNDFVPAASINPPPARRQKMLSSRPE